MSGHFGSLIQVFFDQILTLTDWDASKATGVDYITKYIWSLGVSRFFDETEMNILPVFDCI